MLDSVLNCYNYQNKPLSVTIADTLLYPTRMVLGNKTHEWAPIAGLENGHFPLPKTPEKATSCFVRIILAPIAILMLPITFVACIIKLLNGQNQKIAKIHADYIAAPERTQEDCAICYEPMKKGIIGDEGMALLPCEHAFHPACINPWIATKPTCPLCRGSVPFNKVPLKFYA